MSLKLSASLIVKRRLALASVELAVGALGVAPSVALLPQDVGAIGFSHVLRA